ncbi:MAG: DUF5110 domain-containing protein [Phaeodactylibacter sp.]|nr:DUF5110 domain-containing protein [Phaeodactylibacter sp.]
MTTNIHPAGLFCFLAALALAAVSCTPDNYEKLEDGVLIRLPEGAPDAARMVKLQVVTPDIMHVTATPEDTFSRMESLIAIEKERPAVEWSLKEEGGNIILNTASLSATISRQTGEVTFKDKDGQLLLQEKPGGGKTFTPVTVEGEPFYAIRQVFESPDDEAFYGLGQHQNGQMNYKGEDVELAQHNIVAVAPFLYSNRNYGLLWDNYSITRFGDPRPYAPLSGLELFSQDGRPGGLTATYVNGDGTVAASRQEQQIGYEYLDSFDNLPPEFDMEKGTVTWEGSISAGESGKHKFLAYLSGYTRVWVGGQLILDRWRQIWNPWHTKFGLDMEAGKKYPFKVEWKPDGGLAYLAVKHLSPLSPEEQNQLSLFSEVGRQIDYYFIRGDNADEAIGGYREVTGDAPIMPDWALGFWQSRERYRTQEELLGALREYRQRKIPIDNIVMDWFYWEEDQWGSHAFDPERFPDPAGMVKAVHDMDAHIMISVWPKFYPGTEHFEEMNERGFLYQRNLQKKTKDWVGPGYYSTFYDPFNAEARKLFWQQLKPELFDIGIDAWWMDATEPDINSNESIEERKLLMSPTALGSGAQFFNAYSLMNAKGIYEGLREAAPDKRVFILTRSAFAGQQRYAAATWSGDIVSRWSNFREQIAAGLNFSISGIPYWTMDIGGFSVERRYENATGEDLNEWRELLTRWHQFGAFCPLFRSHGQFPYREIYNVAPEGSETHNSMVFYNKLRYRLLPYIYTLAGRAYHEDYTIMRPLAMDFPEDKTVLDIGDQYLFGPSLLACPVYEYQARSREVYLPAGTGWYDLYSGEYFEGGQSIAAEAPLSRLPLFVKEGSLLPIGPDIQSTNEGFYDSLTVYVYTGRDGSFRLYEDQGENYGYEKGQYATISLDYDEATQTLTVGQRQGSYPEMVQKKAIRAIWASQDAPRPFQPAEPGEWLEYTGEELVIRRTN